jgi:hypothetical protein
MIISKKLPRHPHLAGQFSFQRINSTSPTHFHLSAATSNWIPLDYDLIRLPSDFSVNGSMPL